MLSAQAPAVLRDQRFGNALHSNVKLVRVAPANRRSGAAVVRNTLVMPSLRDQATSTDWRHQMSGPLLWQVNRHLSLMFIVKSALQVGRAPQIWALSAQSTWKQAAEHGVSPALSPTWKVTLLSDGSVTRHLQLMTGHTVDVVRSLRPYPSEMLCRGVTHLLFNAQYKLVKLLGDTGDL